MSVLWIKFDDDRVGKRRRSSHEALYQSRPNLDRHWTSVHRLSKSFTIDKRTHLTEVHRSQFPIRPATASTFQYCQGMTLREGAIDFSGSHLFERHYVGMSRFTREEDFVILDLAEDRIKVSPAVKEEMHHLRLSAQINILPQNVSNNYPSCMTFILFNARSLHCSMDDILADYRFKEADVLLVCETRADETDSNNVYSIPGFKLLRLDAPPSPSRKQGCALYLRDNISAHTHHTLSTNGLQIIVAEIEASTRWHQRFVVLGLYRSPSFSLHSFFTHMSGFIDRFQATNMILMGDFNVDLLSENVPEQILNFFPQSWVCSTRFFPHLGLCEPSQPLLD